MSVIMNVYHENSLLIHLEMNSFYLFTYFYIQGNNYAISNTVLHKYSERIMVQAQYTRLN